MDLTDIIYSNDYINNGDQNEWQYKCRFNATKIFHFQKETDITQKA